MSIFGHANDAPMYKPAPWAKPLTHQIDEMKNNWVQSIEDQMNFIMVSVIFNVVTLIMLAIIVTLHIYGRF
jgi:hypothetical protein